MAPYIIWGLKQLKRCLMRSTVLSAFEALVIVPTKFAFVITDFAVTRKANQFFSPRFSGLIRSDFRLCACGLGLQPIRQA